MSSHLFSKIELENILICAVRILTTISSFMGIASFVFLGILGNILLPNKSLETLLGMG